MTALAQRRSAEVSADLDDELIWLHYTTSVQAITDEDPKSAAALRGVVRRFASGAHPAGSPNGSWNAYVPGRHVLGNLQIDPVSAAALRAKRSNTFRPKLRL